MSKIAVIIITRNRKASLEIAVASVLANTRKPDHFIIVDNNSSDGTKDYILQLQKNISSLTIDYLFEGKTGISNARNRALERIDPDIVAFTDDDCVTSKDWIEQIELSFTKWKDALAIGGYTACWQTNLFALASHGHRVWMTFYNLVDKEKSCREYQRILSQPGNEISLATQNIAYRFQALKKVLPFRSDLKTSSAVDISWKLFTLNPKGIIYNPAIVVHHIYREKFLEFIKLNIRYGWNTDKLVYKARQEKYFPRNSVKPGLFLLWDYFFFSFFFSSAQKVPFWKKIPLLILLLTREIIFVVALLAGSFCRHLCSAKNKILSRYSGV